MEIPGGEYALNGVVTVVDAKHIFQQLGNSPEAKEQIAFADMVLLNKIDLIPWTDFNRDFFYESVRALNSEAPVLELSCRTGEGIEDWVKWLREKQRQVKC